MKAKITSVDYLKEYEGQHGVLYSFKVGYDGKSAFYSSKKRDQTKFVKDQEAEFTEEKRIGKNNQEYSVIKPIYQGKGYSNFGKAQAREKSKYSGFAVSYAKDMVVSGHLQRNELPEYTTVLFDLMVELDKSLKS